MTGLLNSTELAKALGYSREWLSRTKRSDKGFVKQFEVTRPVGQRRYSAVLVERYLAGQSVVALGRGSRGGR